ncbi:hypothetical protein FHL15_004220 [Xylaria flabelliformis]|uniref:Cyanovirin-N domain-containing protein n=1 Tax=Xylaria flabelliformis TaxID=2512241 RepID=A0A553I3H9_9PEZI|nr:hypothetical protein FHL15_004220 [Xylaria flabelliformis]
MHFLATVAVALARGVFVPRDAFNILGSAHLSTNGTFKSFADSCTTYSVHQLNHDAWLGASCRAHDGSQPYSSLNLNLCIANDLGKMVARDYGNFAETCNRMLIHGARPILYAFCDNGSYAEESVIDLGGFIDNDNGHVRCFSHYAA